MPFRKYVKRPETIEAIQLKDNVSQAEIMEILRQNDCEILGWGFAKSHPDDRDFFYGDIGAYWVDFHYYGRKRVKQNEWLVKHSDAKGIRVLQFVDHHYDLVEE